MTLLELAAWIAAFIMFAAFLVEALISRYLLRDLWAELVRRAFAGKPAPR